MSVLIGIAIFALALGVVGCFIGAAESAERRLRELGRHAREPFEFDGGGERSLQPVPLSGPTPTS
jgi:hypothetical protein